MKKLLSLAFVIALALPAFASEESPRYDFTVNVLPSRPGHHSVRVAVRGPDDVLTFSSEMVADEVHTFTSELGTRTVTCVVRLIAEGGGTADLEVKEKGMVIAAAKKLIGSAEPPQFEGIYVRVGGRVRAPVVIHRVEPVYPQEARAERITGIVIVETRISETGTVDDVRVLKPLPFGLDQAAADAVKQWTFRPATLEGKPVPVIFNLTVNFRLQE